MGVEEDIGLMGEVYSTLVEGLRGGIHLRK